MTYGVYNRDLHSVSLSKQYSITACKPYLWSDNDVICSERRHWASFEVKFIFHKWRGVRWRKWEKVFGFVSVEVGTNYYLWADKIVFDPQKEGGVNGSK